MSIKSVMEKAFDKVLPIPKAPRVYRPPPPPKPLTWVPHGKLGNPTYELRLRDFAKEILVINSQRTNPVKYSSRGWSYLLEGLGKIHKGEFRASEKAINDCRKIGLLPIDFVKGDQDETRRFQGIIEASDPAQALREIKEKVKSLLDNLAFLSTDFWIGEKYYLMMCVEKGDILELFKPVCDKYHVPIVSSKGWAPILLRAHIAVLAQKAEARGLTPVLLLFYDHDPAGLKITARFRKNLRDCKRGTGWSPDKLVIDRFGLNREEIEKYNLTWIENLRTGSGRESGDTKYILKYGRRKCESNALFKNDETLKAAEEICRNAIEKYYGPDAKERFKRKEEQSRQKLGEVYEDPLWKKFYTRIAELASSLTLKKEEEKSQPYPKLTMKEVEVIVDDRYYGRCPQCGTSFDYDEMDDGRTLRCRNCGLFMKLRIRHD